MGRFSRDYGRSQHDHDVWIDPRGWVIVPARILSLPLCSSSFKYLIIDNLSADLFYSMSSCKCARNGFATRRNMQGNPYKKSKPNCADYLEDILGESIWASKLKNPQTLYSPPPLLPWRCFPGVPVVSVRPASSDDMLSRDWL